METDVTIVIPVYKRTTYFLKALESALAQTVPVRIIVHDPTPSPSPFLKLVEPYGDRVRYCHFETDLGPSGNWSRGLELAQTKWVSMLHDDDILLPHAIEELLKLTEAIPGKALYFGREDTINEHGQVVCSHDLDGSLEEITPQKLALRNLLSAAGMLLDREIALSLGGFDKRVKATPDWDFWTRLCLHSGAVQIHTVIARYRDYFDLARGTSALQSSGNMLVYSNIQYRRNISRVKQKYPDFSPLFDSQCYTVDAAFFMVRTMGCYLSPRGRRIAFGYVRRRFYRKSYNASCWLKFRAACFCWSRWAYSFVRPHWMRIKSALGLNWGPN